MNKVVQVLGLLVALLLPKERYVPKEHDYIKRYIQFLNGVQTVTWE